MRNKKPTEVSVSYFSRADDCTVDDCYGDIRDEIWYKENAKESNRDSKSYGAIDLSFRIAIG